MKTKYLPVLMALVLCIGAFALPMTACAFTEADTTPPTLTAKVDGETLFVEVEDDMSGVEAVYIDERRISTLVNGEAEVTLKDYAGDGKQVVVYATDFSGNHSKAVKFDNPYYKEPTTTPAPTAPAPSPGAQGSTSKPQTSTPTTKPSATPTPTPSETPKEETESAAPEGAFTPDGTGTTQDSATGEEGDKQFYTITTAAGNVFYLIIDGKRTDNNVYFLNGVTEADLMALAEKGDGSVSAAPELEKCTCTNRCEAGKVNTACPVCKTDLTACIGKAAIPAPEAPEQDAPKEEKGGSTGMILFVVLALVAAGGAGYYFKIVRPKQQAVIDDEDEEDVRYDENYAYEEEYLEDDEREEIDEHE